MPVYKINHKTKYTYNSPARECINQIMLYPIQDKRQKIISHKISISSHPQVETFIDYFGNGIGLFSIVHPHQELMIISDVEIIASERDFPEDNETASLQWEQLASFRQQYPYIDFLQSESFGKTKEFLQFTNSVFDFNETPFKNALNFSTYIFEHFEYKKGITSIETSVEEIWRLKAGVCQDFAHLLLLILRSIGIPARYVSGYICPKNNEFRGVGATHACVEAFVPNIGWIGLDPTNNCIANERHIRLAVGRNFSDCTPVKGTYKGPSDHLLEVSVSINNNEMEMIEETKNENVVAYSTNNQPEKTSGNSYRIFMEQMQQQQ